MVAYVLPSVVAVIVFIISGQLGAVEDPDGDWKANRPNDSKILFLGNALDFLRQFGKQSGLFDYFFNNEQITYPPDSRSGRVRDFYNVLDVNSLYQNYSGIAGPDDGSRMLQFPVHAYSQHKYPTANYDNRYRFGRKENARFMYIGVPTHQDLWNETLLDSASYIHFIGFETALKRADYYCEFSYPIKVASKVYVRADFLYPNGQSSPEQVVKCEVPTELKQFLLGRKATLESQIESDSDSNAARLVDEVQLSLVAGAKVDECCNKTLLPDVRVPRLPLQGRRFSICQNLMVEELEEPLLKEYLVYYSMLGVEHFFIYDNSKRPPPDSFETSQLREFLDANVVTLIHFPYTHEAPRLIQRVAANVHYQIYGHTCYWSGMIDMDEFYFPGQQFRRLLNSTDSNNSSSNSLSLLLEVMNYSQGLSNKPPEEYPGLMANSLEMGCADPLIDPDARAKNEFHLGMGASPTPFIVNCIIRGHLFDEWSEGHAKFYAKPWREEMFTSPHRILPPHVPHMCGDYMCYANGTVQGTEHGLGVFFHFNGFKYGARGPYNFIGFNVYDTHYALSRFVLELLKYMVGVQPLM